MIYLTNGSTDSDILSPFTDVRMAKHHSYEVRGLITSITATATATAIIYVAVVR